MDVPRPITRNKEIGSGKPAIDGTRLTCGDVVHWVNHMGSSLADFLALYSYLTKSDVIEALRYCAAEECTLGDETSFCGGCSHDTEAIVDGEDEEPCEDLWKLARATLTDVTG